MPLTIEGVALPNTRAISFLRNKLRIPTERWDDFLGDIHAKGFAIAGAIKIDLLKDFHDALNEAIENGEGISAFRRQFDDIVKKHGWSYKGDRGWRTRVIYDNNLRSAKMAGRWSQMQETKDRRPYLQYLTVGDDRVRAQHRVWDRMILPIDDVFWNTAYPPNDYGCRCTVRSLSEHDVLRYGMKVSNSPKLQKSLRVNNRTGEVYGEVPDGIGVGWNYNVGKAWLSAESVFAEKIANLPARMRNNIFMDISEPFQYVQVELPIPGNPRSFAHWGNTLRNSAPNGEYRPVSYLSPTVLSNMELHGVTPKTALIVIDDLTLKKAVQRYNFRDSELTDLLTALSYPIAVYLDEDLDRLLWSIDLGTRHFLVYAAVLGGKMTDKNQRSIYAHAVTNILLDDDFNTAKATLHNLFKRAL